MRARNFHILFRIHGHAIAPIHYAVLARVNGGLNHRIGDLAAKGVYKIAGTASGVTIGQDSAAMLLEDLETNRFGGAEDCSIGNRATDGRCERDYGSHVFWSRASHRAGDHSPKAMPDHMNLAPGLLQCFFDGLVQTALDEQVGTFCVNADAGKIGPVSNAPKPGVKLGEVKVGAEESGNDDDGRTVPARYTQAVVHGGCVQQQNFCSEERFGPKTGSIGFRIGPRSRFAPRGRGRTRCCRFLFTPQVRPWVCPFSALTREEGRMLHCKIITRRTLRFKKTFSA